MSSFTRFINSGSTITTRLTRLRFTHQNMNHSFTALCEKTSDRCLVEGTAANWRASPGSCWRDRRSRCRSADTRWSSSPDRSSDPHTPRWSSAADCRSCSPRRRAAHTHLRDKHRPSNLYSMINTLENVLKSIKEKVKMFHLKKLIKIRTVLCTKLLCCFTSMNSWLIYLLTALARKKCL